MSLNWDVSKKTLTRVNKAAWLVGNAYTAETMERGMDRDAVRILGIASEALELLRDPTDDCFQKRIDQIREYLDKLGD